MLVCYVGVYYLLYLLKNLSRIDLVQTVWAFLETNAYTHLEQMIKSYIMG